MTMKIKIYNLNPDINDRALERLFLPYGVVNSAVVNRNALNGRSNGNGVVEMPLDNQAENAIASLDHTMVMGKMITVSRYESAD
jgi:RNA recognition motif-containing protein